MDKGRAAEVIYLSLCKPFDVLPHHIPISKRERCEFEGCLVDKELVGWLQPEGCAPWFYVQMEAGDEWHPTGLGSGTSTP